LDGSLRRAARIADPDVTLDPPEHFQVAFEDRKNLSISLFEHIDCF
jgi:hypothetical protein